MNTIEQGIFKERNYNCTNVLSPSDPLPPLPLRPSLPLFQFLFSLSFLFAVRTRSGGPGPGSSPEKWLLWSQLRCLLFSVAHFHFTTVQIVINCKIKFKYIESSVFSGIPYKATRDESKSLALFAPTEKRITNTCSLIGCRLAPPCTGCGLLGLLAATEHTTRQHLVSVTACVV